MATIRYTAAQLLSPENKQLFDEFVCLMNLSFATDPMTNWLFKNASTHDKFMKKLTYYHRAMLRLALLSGARVIAIREEDDGIRSCSTQDSNIPTISKTRISFKAMSILIPPSGNKIFESTLAHLRAGLLPFALHAGFSPMARLLIGFMPKLEEMVSSLYPAPNEHRKHRQWHLLVLATRPDCQGQGLGGAIMLQCQEIVQDAALRSKRLGEYICPLYLESSTVGSKRLYNRMGFVDRGVMEYGTVKEGETVSHDEDGKVSGAKLFALMWTPGPFSN